MRLENWKYFFPVKINISVALSIMNFACFFSTYRVFWGQVLWLGLTEIQNSPSFEKSSTSVHSKGQSKSCQFPIVKNVKMWSVFTGECTHPLFLKVHFITKWSQTFTNACFPQSWPSQHWAWKPSLARKACGNQGSHPALESMLTDPLRCVGSL